MGQMIVSEILNNAQLELVGALEREGHNWVGQDVGLASGGKKLGIKVSDENPLYVLSINADKNEIIVGPKEKLGKKNIFLKDVNILGNKNDFNKNIFVKVRSTGNLLEAKINLDYYNKAEVKLIYPEDGISPGQACVFYKKDKIGFKVLGGGWIS